MWLVAVRKVNTHLCGCKLKGMSQRTNAQVFYGVARSEVTDNFSVCTLSSPQIDEAFIQVFKCTPNEAFLKVDAFITGGLAGVLALQGQNKSVRTRTEIRDIIMRGFREFNFGC